MKKHECEPFAGKLPRGLGRYRKRVTDYFSDSDGTWAYLVPGWKREPNDNVHFIRIDPEDGESFKDLVEGVKTAKKCNCEECMALIKEFTERNEK